MILNEFKPINGFRAIASRYHQTKRLTPRHFRQNWDCNSRFPRNTVSKFPTADHLIGAPVPERSERGPQEGRQRRVVGGADVAKDVPRVIPRSAARRILRVRKSPVGDGVHVFVPQRLQAADSSETFRVQVQNRINGVHFFILEIVFKNKFRWDKLQ